jgi:hypothetical protein
MTDTEYSEAPAEETPAEEVETGEAAEEIDDAAEADAEV